MVLHGSSLAVELIVNDPRGELGVGVVEAAGDRASRSKTLGRTGETKQALGEHGGRETAGRRGGWTGWLQCRRSRPQTNYALGSPVMPLMSATGSRDVIHLHLFRCPSRYSAVSGGDWLLVLGMGFRITTWNGKCCASAPGDS